METVFVSVLATILPQIAIGIVANMSYDALKCTVDFSGLKNRLMRFFCNNPNETEQFIEVLCNREARNPEKPYRDIEDIFMEKSKDEYSEEVYDEIKNWITENTAKFSNITNIKMTNKKGMNIGTQKAHKNIYNIQGDFIVGKDEHED